MYWWIGTFLGSVFLAIKNSLSKTLDLTLINSIFIFIPLILAGLFYWYGFRHAPKFINCWFLGTAFNSFSCVALGLLFFDKAISLQTMAGIACVMAGAYLLIK